MFKKLFQSLFSTVKTPGFWHESGLLSQLLMPLSVFYFFGKRLNFSKVSAKKFNLKVICVGNVTAGGAGKTPTAIAIRKEILKLKPAAKIAFISTGYKGKLQGPVLVNAAEHKVADVGDEALILASHGYAIVSKKRIEGVSFAEENGFEYVILDDGMHDKTIHKDITFLVIDGKYGFGNRLLIPAGPLRDRLDYAVEGVDRIILIGDDKNGSVQLTKKYGRKNFSVTKSFINPVTDIDEKLVYIAFAGIGRPQKFFNMLKNEMKLAVVETVEFADHHNYSKADIGYLRQVAKDNKAKLITTEKDFIKLPTDFAAEVECMKIELVFDDGGIEEVLATI